MCVFISFLFFSFLLMNAPASESKSWVYFSRLFYFISPPSRGITTGGMGAGGELGLGPLLVFFFSLSFSSGKYNEVGYWVFTFSK